MHYLGSLPRFKTKEPVAPSAKALLLDVSGSMWLSVEPNLSKIEALRQLASQFPGLRKFVFSSFCSECHGPIPDPDSDTYMDLAFNTVKQNGVQHVVLMTDGLPTCTFQAALAAAQGLRIDVFYIGRGEIPQFLRDLAAQCGGEVGQTTLTKPELPALEKKVRALLQ